MRSISSRLRSFEPATDQPN